MNFNLYTKCKKKEESRPDLVNVTNTNNQINLRKMVEFNTTIRNQDGKDIKRTERKPLISKSIKGKV